MKPVARFLLAPLSRVYAIILFLAVVGLAIYGFQISSEATNAAKTATAANAQNSQIIHRVQVIGRKLIHDEQVGCKIQSIGLPANKELAASLRDIHILLTLPVTAASKARQKAETPPKQLKTELGIVHDLNEHLARYQADEAAQPAKRKCAF